MTPLAVVIALFGIEKPIFGFKRDEKSFVVCFILIFLALQLYTNLVSLAQRMGLWQKLVAGAMLLQSKHSVGPLSSHGKLFYPVAGCLNTLS